MIGNVLFDAVLMPLQQIMELIARFTGFDWAQSAADSIKAYRTDLALNTTSDESGQVLPDMKAKAAVNPKVEEQNSTISKMYQQNVAISINDPKKQTTVTTDNDLVPIRMGSTLAFP